LWMSALHLGDDAVSESRGETLLGIDDFDDFLGDEGSSERNGVVEGVHLGE